jgi:hypothetical protein
MKNKSWLFNQFSKVFMTIALIVLWSSCADDSSNVTQAVKNPAASGSASAFSTQDEYSTTVTLSQNDGAQVWSYEISMEVSWSGSSSTWTYTVSPFNGPDDTMASKNLSHVNFGGLNACVLESLLGDFAFGGDNGGCGALPAGSVHKFDGLEDDNFSFSFTLPAAYSVDNSGLTIWVKAGNDCQSLTIPGPSCSTLGLSGSVNQIVCTGTTFETQVFAGATVTATQGTSDSRTATADENGNYSFSNLGGIWTISVDGVFAGASTDVAVGPSDGVAATLTADNRINGSCAGITGHADREDCVNQSPVITPYAGATVTGGPSAAVTDANGNFSFSNVVDGTYSISVGGVVYADVTVSGSQGSYSAGTVTVSFITSICGGDPDPACSLSQGYWFAKPQSVWTNGLTLGNQSYTRAEGVAIWNTTNKGGLLNVKAAYTQAAAIKLSGVDASASVWADVAIIESYLSTLPKLTAANIGTYKNQKSGPNAAAGAAAGRIGSWIDANHCAETN